MYLKKIKLHPEYNNKNYDNDIAILELNQKINYDTYLRPICLPTQETELFPGKVVLVSGFGVSNFRTKSVEEKLQKVSLDKISLAVYTFIFTFKLFKAMYSSFFNDFQMRF